VRLVLWYLAVLAPATLALAAGSWWLARRSVNDEVDRTLQARIDGARTFLTDMADEHLGAHHMKEEFGEYVELSHGEALLDVTDSAGEVLSRPGLAGWPALIAGIDLTTPDPSGPPRDRALNGDPYRVASETFTAGGSRYHVVVAMPVRAGRDALRRFAWILVGLVPIVLVIAGIGGYAIAGRALAPVDRMTRIVQETTLRNLDRRLDVPMADEELRRLAVTFNDMLGRMQAGVADLTRLTAEASHELRTPVSLVRTTAEVALSRPRSTDEYREALEDVLGHAVRMSSLVGNLLALARADAGVETGEPARVDVARLARELGQDFRSTVLARSLGLVVAADTPVHVMGDAASLRRLLVILLENAVAYTPAGGRIDLSVTGGARSPSATAVVDVFDTGIGLDSSERERVFDRFYRGAAAREHVAEGSGLGLSIARAIVARARGTIELGPGPGGRGCHARVTLPSVAVEQEAGHEDDLGHRDLDHAGARAVDPEPANH
jgi:signal transduction histidine kinase